MTDINKILPSMISSYTEPTYDESIRFDVNTSLASNYSAFNLSPKTNDSSAVSKLFSLCGTAHNKSLNLGILPLQPNLDKNSRQFADKMETHLSCKYIQEMRVIFSSAEAINEIEHFKGEKPLSPEEIDNLILEGQKLGQQATDMLLGGDEQGIQGMIFSIMNSHKLSSLAKNFLLSMITNTIQANYSMAQTKELYSVQSAEDIGRLNPNSRFYKDTLASIGSMLTEEKDQKTIQRHINGLQERSQEAEKDASFFHEKFHVIGKIIPQSSEPTQTLYH